jgi:hypothetical protein
MLLALTLLSCGGHGQGKDQAIVLPADITLKNGEPRIVDSVAITFVKVVEDSRCPANVQCVWAGNAMVELSIAKGPDPAALRFLNSTTEPRAIEEAGFRITWKSLLPAPVHGAAAPSEFTLTVHVEKP